MTLFVEQMVDLIRKADLTTLTININRNGTVYSYAHSNAGDDRFCASSGDFTLTNEAEAIKLAIFNLNAKRHAVEVADLAPVEGLAA